jgi:hypothetical protein
MKTKNTIFLFFLILGMGFSTLSSGVQIVLTDAKEEGVLIERKVSVYFGEDKIPVGKKESLLIPKDDRDLDVLWNAVIDADVYGGKVPVVRFWNIRNQQEINYVKKFVRLAGERLKTQGTKISCEAFASAPKDIQDKVTALPEFVKKVIERAVIDKREKGPEGSPAY